MADPFDQGWSIYDLYVQAVIDNILTEKVWPLFKERGYKMLSGNGTFHLEDADGVSLATDPEFVEEDPEFVAVLEILNTPIPGMPANDLGSYSPDYPPKEEPQQGIKKDIRIGLSIDRSCTVCHRFMDHAFLNGCMNGDKCPHGYEPCL